MTNLVRTELEAAIAADLPDNTEQIITAARLRSACTDLNDTIFRKNAIALEDKTGRIMLEQGGYLLQEDPPAPQMLTGLVGFWEHDESGTTDRVDSHNSYDLLDANLPTATTAHIGSYATSFVGLQHVYNSANHALFAGGATDWTFGTWLNQDHSATTHGYIAAHGVYGGSGIASNYSWFLNWNYLDANLRLSVSNGSAFEIALAGPTTDDTWVFVLAEQDYAAKKIYVSVNLGTRGSQTITTPTTTGNYFGLNRYSTASSNTKQDSGFFYSRLLTDSEKSFMYNSGTGRAYLELS